MPVLIFVATAIVFHIALRYTKYGKYTYAIGGNMQAALRTGMVWVNTYRAVAVQTPFGGIKDSGFGRERGEQGLLEFTTTKNVMIDFSGDKRDPFSMKL